jgi:hypothetical protein
MSRVVGWDMQVLPDPVGVECSACRFGLVGTRNLHYNPHHVGEEGLDGEGWCWNSRKPVAEHSRLKVAA